MTNTIITDPLVLKYTQALNSSDIDTCIECIRASRGEQKDLIREQWNLFYNVQN